jgi:hypothetical protein
MAQLKNTSALSFASNSGKLHRIRMKCSKQLSVTMPCHARALHAQSEASQVEHQKHVSDLFNVRAMFIRNLFLQTKRLTSITTGKFFNV